jgi:hypothetical protein
MAEHCEQGLDARCSYGSSNATASEDDGGSGVYPSHGELDMHKKMLLRILSMNRVTALAVQLMQEWRSAMQEFANIS